MSEAVTIKNIAFKADPDVVNSASVILKENGYSLSKALTLFLKNVVLTGSVELPNEREIDNELLFKQLQTEVKESIAEVQAGHYYTDEDLVKRYGL